jgi:hypothetical protein
MTGAPNDPPANTAEPSTCPWCSASVPAAASTCPSCGASLKEAAEGDILGVTQVDPAAISRASRIKPGRLATLLGAEKPDEPDDLGGRVEPPSKEVREEMLRLELAAIDAELEARATQAAANRELPPEDRLMADVTPSSGPSEGGAAPAPTAAPAPSAAPEASAAAKSDATPDAPMDAQADGSESKPG